MNASPSHPNAPLSNAARSLIVGGLTPFTTIDYPGKLAAVVFCRGCPFNCVYCHNTHLRSTQTTSNTPKLGWDEIYAFLLQRRSWLEAVVFSGGEPTEQQALIPAMHLTKELGLLLGLHTAGTNAAALARCLSLVDWVGFDVKAPFDERYDLITQIPDSYVQPLASLKLLLSSGVSYQVRTTVDPAYLSEQDLKDLNEQLAAMGATQTVQQDVIYRC